MRTSLFIAPVAVGAAIFVIADPAFAISLPSPAPVAGVGLGAFALIGAGYRALKRRIDR